MQARRLLLFLLLLPGWVLAAEWRAVPDETPLQQVLEAAAPGDTVRVAEGVHRGNFVVEVPMTLVGEPGAILDGQQQNSVLTIAVPGVTVRDLHIRGDGADIDAIDSAVFVAAEATGTRLENNRIEARGFGVWLDGAADARIIGNRIRSEEHT